MRQPLCTFWITLATLIAPTVAFAGKPTIYQTSNAFNFVSGAPVAGAAALYRSPQSLRTALSTSGLDVSSAFTVWWVIFNNPSACAAVCGESDLGNPATQPSVLYATGFLSDANGTANVVAQLDAGAPPHGVDVLVGEGLRQGNGFSAEVHLVVRSHGAPIPGQVARQISTFEPACVTCSDRQAVRFAPVK